MRVIDADGQQLGVMDKGTAIRIAFDKSLDLVEVSPGAQPPVCRIMDFGKYKYALKKKAQEAKKKQQVVVLKEIKFRPKTEEHDIDFKLRHVRRFLSEGNKAKLTIMFRGREMAHTEVGFDLMKRLLDQLKNEAVIDQPAKLEGRALSVIVSALKPGQAPVKEKKPASTATKVAKVAKVEGAGPETAKATPVKG